MEKFNNLYEEIKNSRNKSLLLSREALCLFKKYKSNPSKKNARKLRNQFEHDFNCLKLKFGYFVKNKTYSVKYWMAYLFCIVFGSITIVITIWIIHSLIYNIKIDFILYIGIDFIFATIFILFLIKLNKYNFIFSY